MFFYSINKDSFYLSSVEALILLSFVFNDYKSFIAKFVGLRSEGLMSFVGDKMLLEDYCGAERK